MEGLNHTKANLVVYLHPSKAKCPSDAILGELSSLLFTYNESLDGVVLAFNPEIISPYARIIPGIYPNLGVELKAELLLFSPKPDMIVEGEVVSVTPNGINAVVLGFSSASIAREDVREEFRFRSRKGFFLSRVDRKHMVRVGTILRFQVKSFDGETLHLLGSMVGEDTGCVRWLDKNVDVWNQVEATNVERIVKVKKEENGLVEDGGMISIEDDKKLKNSKKTRVEEEDVKAENGLVTNQEMYKLNKIEVEEEEIELEAKEDMLVKDGEKSKKSKKTRVREEKVHKEENGLVTDQDLSSLKEDDVKPKKSKKRRKELS